jgi:hypothetical protein
MAIFGLLIIGSAGPPDISSRVASRRDRRFVWRPRQLWRRSIELRQHKPDHRREQHDAT